MSFKRDILRQLKLIVDVNLIFPIAKSDFVKKLDEMVQLGTTDIYPDNIWPINIYEKPLKGFVNENEFKLIRNPRRSNTLWNFAVVSGKFHSKDGYLYINYEIVGFSNMLWMGLCFFDFLLIIMMIGSSEFLSLFVLVCVSLILLIIPYFVFRRSVQFMRLYLTEQFENIVLHLK